MAAASPPLGARDLAVAGVMNLLWGLNMIAAKMAVGAFEPLTAAFLRQAMVFAVCATWLRLVPGRMGALVLLGALSGGLFYILINLSLAVSENVGALAIAGQLGVPFSLILAVIVFRESVGWRRSLGIALSFAGVAVLVFDPSAAGEAWGLLLTAAASLVWAICSLIQRRLGGVPVLTIYAWIGLVGMLTMGVIAWTFEPAAMRGLGEARLSALGWVAFSAVGSTVIGQGSMAWLLQRHPISSVVPLTLASPVIAVFAAAYYFGTPLTLGMLIGGAMAMLGVGIVSIRTARRAEEASA